MDDSASALAAFFASPGCLLALLAVCYVTFLKVWKLDRLPNQFPFATHLPFLLLYAQNLKHAMKLRDAVREAESYQIVKLASVLHIQATWRSYMNARPIAVARKVADAQRVRACIIRPRGGGDTPENEGFLSHDAAVGARFQSLFGDESEKWRLFACMYERSVLSCQPSVAEVDLIFWDNAADESIITKLFRLIFGRMEQAEIDGMMLGLCRHSDNTHHRGNIDGVCDSAKQRSTFENSTHEAKRRYAIRYLEKRVGVFATTNLGGAVCAPVSWSDDLGHYALAGCKKGVVVASHTSILRVADANFLNPSGRFFMRMSFDYFLDVIGHHFNVDHVLFNSSYHNDDDFTEHEYSAWKIRVFAVYAGLRAYELVNPRSGACVPHKVQTYIDNATYNMPYEDLQYLYFLAFGSLDSRMRSLAPPTTHSVMAIVCSGQVSILSRGDRAEDIAFEDRCSPPRVEDLLKALSFSAMDSATLSKVKVGRCLRQLLKSNILSRSVSASVSVHDIIRDCMQREVHAISKRHAKSVKDKKVTTSGLFVERPTPKGKLLPVVVMGTSLSTIEDALQTVFDKVGTFGVPKRRQIRTNDLATNASRRKDLPPNWFGTIKGGNVSQRTWMSYKNEVTGEKTCSIKQAWRLHNGIGGINSEVAPAAAAEVEPDLSPNDSGPDSEDIGEQILDPSRLPTPATECFGGLDLTAEVAPASAELDEEAPDIEGVPNINPVTKKFNRVRTPYSDKERTTPPSKLMLEATIVTILDNAVRVVNGGKDRKIPKFRALLDDVQEGRVRKLRIAVQARFEPNVLEGRSAELKQLVKVTMKWWRDQRPSAS